jgi:hypothetical protein
MPEKGVKEAGKDSLSTYDSSAEVSEEDYKPGQRRKSGQDVEDTSV